MSFETMVGGAGSLAGLGVAAKYFVWDPLYSRCRSKRSQWTMDLGGQAARGEIKERVYEREGLLDRLIALIGTNKGVGILVGPPGVGKTALIEEIAQRIHEGKIPSLSRVHILSLQLSAMIPQKGALSAWRAFLGQISKSIQDLVVELQEQNALESGERYVLFIDEIQDLFVQDCCVFDDLKSLLAREGVMIIGATTDQKLIDDWLARREADRGMRRRVEVIPVPPMDSVTTSQALRGIAAHAFVKLTGTAFSDLIHLAEIEPEHFPAKGVLRLNQLVQYAKDQGESEIDRRVVLAYFKTVTQASQETLVKILAEADQKTQFQRTFQEGYCPLLPFTEQSVRDLREMGQQIVTFSQGHSQILVEGPSASLLQGAMQSTALSRETLRRCSVKELLGAHREHPQDTIRCLETCLDEMYVKSVPLVIEDTNPLLEVLFPQTASLDLRSALSPLQNGVLSRVAAPLEQIGQAVYNLQNRVEPQQKKEEIQTSPILRALLKHLQRGAPCILLARSRDMDLIERAKRAHWGVLQIQDFAPWQLIDWLATQGIPLEVATRILGAACSLSMSDPTISLADFCDQVVKQLRQRGVEEFSDAILNLAICAAAHGRFCARQVEEALRYPLPQWEQMLRAATPPEIPSPHLEKIAPQLQRILSTSQASMVWVQEPSAALRKFLTDAFCQSCGDTLAFLDTAQLRTLRVDLQLLYAKELGRRWSAGPVPKYLCIQAEDLKIAGLETSLLELAKTKRVQILCFSNKSPAHVQGSAGVGGVGGEGVLDQVIQRGTQLLQEQGVLNAPKETPPSVWNAVSNDLFTLGPLTPEQFALWMQTLLPASWPLPTKQAFEQVYRELYTRSDRPFTIDEIQALVAPDARGERPADLTEYFVGKLGSIASLSPLQVAYLVDPSSTPLTYRLYRKAQTGGLVLVSWAASPFQWLSLFLGSGLSSVLQWTAGSTLLTWARRWMGW